jgi:hypothetical protein
MPTSSCWQQVRARRPRTCMTPLCAASAAAAPLSVAAGVLPLQNTPPCVCRRTAGVGCARPCAGVPALQQLTLRSPLLGAAQDLASCMALDCSDVLAVRLWLDRKVPLSTPSNVLAGFDEGVGGTLFQLDALQVCCCRCALLCVCACLCVLQLCVRVHRTSVQLGAWACGGASTRTCVLHSPDNRRRTPRCAPACVCVCVPAGRLRTRPCTPRAGV